MRWFTSVMLLVLACLTLQSHQTFNNEDNEFAEFEDFEEDDQMFEGGAGRKETDKSAEASKIVMSPEADLAASAQEDATVDEEEEDTEVGDDDEEFSHLNNEEEFEGFKDDKKNNKQPPNLKFVKVPLHLHTNWEHYYIEMVMLVGLSAYLLNYLAGKAKNHKIAENWLAVHKQMLEENFAVVGDDGLGTETGGGVGCLSKEADNVFIIWCSGRTCCEGMLVTLKLLKRQDLVSVISAFFRPILDQIIVHVEMEEGEMDAMVFCLAHKRVVSKLQKEHEDLSNYCGEKRGVEKYQLPSHLQLLSESPEVTSFVLDNRVTMALKRYEEHIEYMHFSDQYCAVKPPEDSPPSKAPERSKVLIFCFNMSTSKYSRNMEALKPLMQMILYLVDKLKRFKLTKEAKLKAERNRQRMVEAVVKAGHVGRSEAAQNRKEEKKRMEKEKIMNEGDPDKQRRLEEKNLKKEAKKKQPRMKRMKIKSM